MIKSPDEALRKFNDLWKNKWSNLSETDTRCKILDPLFKECLNWDEKNIIREEHSDSGFIDYAFKAGNRTLFVVEAKKEGINFDIPDNFKNRIYSINGVITKVKNLISTIEKAQKYCIDHGSRIGMATNGHQYVIFEAFKPGFSWKEGRCIIYNGYEDISKHFGSFWNLLNKNSVENGSLIKVLSDKPDIIFFERPLDKVHNKEEKLTRNYLHEYLSPFSDYIFDEIISPSHLDILKKCYVWEKAYGSVDKEIKNYFIDRMPHYSNEHNIKFFIEGEKDAGLFKIDFEKCESFARTQTDRGAMILLLGGIGSGKTTFLHRFFKIILKEKLKFLWFYIDFRKSPIEKSKIENFIYTEMINQFEKQYYSEIKNELEEFTYSFDKRSPEKYVSRLISLLKCMRYSVALVIDNVDQHETKLQENIFKVSENITDKLRLTTILSLREESYYRSTLIGSLDAYNKRKFHISSPKFEQLIMNRIDYLLDFLKNDSENIENIKRTLRTSLDVENKIDEIILFFKIIKNSLKRKTEYKSSPLTYFITEISAGDMRTALRMFNTYLISGNTKISDMFDLYKKEKKLYNIANFQFIKSVILGDSKYYMGDKSFIFNLFETNPPYSNSHFLNLRILNYAHLNKGNDSHVGRGFTEIEKLKSEAEDFFINPKAVETSLLKMAKHDLICFENKSKTDIKNASYFCITSTGSYYLKQLIRYFIYLDLISGDTPIYDINVAKSIRRLIDTTDMERRFERTEIYLKYLLEAENDEFEASPEFKDSNLTNKKYMEEVLQNFSAQKEFIRKKQYKKQLI